MSELLPVEREALILKLVQDRNAVSIRELSDACHVTDVTIRRDLARLESLRLVQRTHGGVTRINGILTQSIPPAAPLKAKPTADDVDALITTYPRTPRSRLVFDHMTRQQIPIIAESEMRDGARYVGINHYEASYALGQWMAREAKARFKRPLRILDITYHFPGARERSRGFVEGVYAVDSSAAVVFSSDGRSMRDSSRQVIEDAMALNPEINIIFAVNDENAFGALDACETLGLSDRHVIIGCVGLDGVRMRQMLAQDTPLKACAAMFPELVGRVLLGTAIQAFQGPLETTPIFTPSVVVTHETLENYYCAPTWEPHAGVIDSMIKNFPDSHNRQAHAGKPLPKTVGFVVPFNDHEWYTSLIAIIQHESNRLGITLLVKDASATPSAELDQLALMIGTKAAELVRDHEIIILDHEPASLYLAQALRDNPAYKFQNLTVITNSLTILQTLSKVDGCKLVLMGGDYDAAQQALTGRAAALSLQEFQADKAFIGIAGVNQQFGISSTDPVLADTQRAIIQAAKQVIVLSDHTRIGAAARVRVAPLACVHVLVTDIGIAPENRLALTQLGIQVEVAPGETPVSTLK